MQLISHRSDLTSVNSELQGMWKEAALFQHFLGVTEESHAEPQAA
jgi:hypothetical protein